MNEKTKRIFMTVAGCLLMAVSIGFFKASLFGADPFQTFASGLNSLLCPDIGYGNFYIFLNLPLLVLVFFFGRRYIGFETVMTMLLTGHISEAVRNALVMTQSGTGVRVVFLLFGVLLLTFSVSLYFTGDMGVSAYDAVSRIIADRTGAKYGTIRRAADIFCMFLGFLFGSEIGAGTFLAAFCTGPLTDFFRKNVAEPILRGRRGAWRLKRA